MLYSCTHMATVGDKGLIPSIGIVTLEASEQDGKAAENRVLMTFQRCNGLLECRDCYSWRPVFEYEQSSTVYTLPFAGPEP